MRKFLMAFASVGAIGASQAGAAETERQRVETKGGAAQHAIRASGSSANDGGSQTASLDSESREAKARTARAGNVDDVASVVALCASTSISC